jgi:hypothetical protein
MYNKLYNFFLSRGEAMSWTESQNERGTAAIRYKHKEVDAGMLVIDPGPNLFRLSWA